MPYYNVRIKRIFSEYATVFIHADDPIEAKQEALIRVDDADFAGGELESEDVESVTVDPNSAFLEPSPE